MKPKKTRVVREPLQVYLARDERALLDQLARETGLSRAEVLRRGLRSLAAELQGAASPMLDLVNELAADDWPADLALRHDAHLADQYRPSA
jgi:hypothetical protein